MKRRKTILFLTHRVPFPPNKGDKIRTFHQLERLAASHDVYCGCFVDSPEDRIYAAALRQWCRGVVVAEWSRSRAKLRAISGLVGSSPLTLAAYENEIFKRQLLNLAERVRFDAVIAFSACMAPYAQVVPAGRHVLDLCDADSEKWRDYSATAPFPLSALYKEEAARLRDYELSCIRQFDATMVITPRERQALDPSGSLRKLHVVSNGVDLPTGIPRPASKRPPVVSFVGALDYRPNVEGICWFTRHVWPGVQGWLPNSRLMIVGRSPSRAVRRLKSYAGVTVVGEVPDVKLYLARSRVVVAPLMVARGLQNKVLEAMAMRRPVVATSTVAACMDVEPGRQLLVADDSDQFTRRVVDLCRVDRLCDRVASAGYRFVAAHHSWSESMERYEWLVLGEVAAVGEVPTPKMTSVQTEPDAKTTSSAVSFENSRMRIPGFPVRQPRILVGQMATLRGLANSASDTISAGC